MAKAENPPADSGCCSVEERRLPMTRGLVLLCATMLLLGPFAVVNAAPIWLDGVSESSGWLDTDKLWNDDFNLCWAATAANLLSKQGWYGGPRLMTGDAIFADIKHYWSDRGGNPYYAVDWWFTGENKQQGSPGWAQLTDLSHTGFYSDTLFPDNFAWGNFNDLSDIATYLENDRAVSIMIEYHGLGHFLTVWGVDPDTRELWVTDSDNFTHSLDKYTFRFDGTLDGAYDDWGINSYYGLFANQKHAPRLREQGTDIPEPATLFLIGTGIFGLTVFGKKAWTTNPG